MFLHDATPNEPTEDKLKASNAIKELKHQSETNLNHIMQQIDNENINVWWTLLDNQSTVDVFSNGKLLKNIHKTQSSLKITSTGGTTTTDMIGYLEGYGWVWFYPAGIANILSLARVKNKYCVTFDSSADNQFHVVSKNQQKACTTQISVKVKVVLY